MLYFRDHHWLRVNGASRFEAHISGATTTREDVHWCLSLNFIAGGARWRRVRSGHRPRCNFYLSSIRSPHRSWKGLETHNFWADPEKDEFHDAWDWFYHGAGFLEVVYYSEGRRDAPDYTFGGSMVWRVVEREGRWFTIEMAGLADGTNLFSLEEKLPIIVTPDGEETRGDPDEAFWKANSVFYLIEQVPFGSVTVTVPRNVADPDAYALARARALIGVGEPEHIEIIDHSPHVSPGEQIASDLYVELHFNGFYED